MRRLGTWLVAPAFVLSACTSVGVGVPRCQPVASDPAPAAVLAVQAVPTARYVPCVEGTAAAWDSVEFSAQAGEVEIEAERAAATILTVTLEAACDVGGLEPRQGSQPDITRFESITLVSAGIPVTVVPVAPDDVPHSRDLVEMWDGVDASRGRRLEVVLDADTTTSVADRTSSALGSGRFVWIVEPHDAVNGTIGLVRSNGVREVGIDPREAVERLEELTPVPSYRGTWHLVFEGGCITYTFDARGSLARQAAADAERNLSVMSARDIRVSSGLEPTDEP